MELYHIHKSNSYDKQYKEGNTIIVGKTINNFKKIMLDGSASLVYKTRVRPDGKTVNYNKNILDFLERDKINNMTEEKRYKLLQDVRNYILKSELDIRELILEEVRTKFYPDRPSRYNCIWLCTKGDVETWKRLLKTKEGNYQVFKVITAKKPFYSLNKLLPDLHYSRDMMYKQAMHYWNPTEEDLRKRGREYLYTGELKIKERIM